MHHYADRCCINLDNWSIFQQHNWHNYAWFFCFHDDNESEAVEAHIPRHRDSKTKKPRHRDSKTKKTRHRDSKTKKPQHWDSKTIKPRHRETKANKPLHRDSEAFFLEDKKPQHRDSKTKKPRHRDSKAKKPRHQVPVEFWPLCPWYFWLDQLLTTFWRAYYKTRNTGTPNYGKRNTGTMTDYTTEY